MIKKIQFVLLGAVLLNLSAMSAASASTTVKEVSNRPVVFVHGFNVFGFGEDCQKDWGIMRDTMKAQGFTGPLVTFGFYGHDPHCDVITSPKGTILTSVHDLARDLAWGMYNKYTANNVAIDVVAHSLGGLLTRYALYRVSVGDVTYPPLLKISHVTTMGSPYKGYNLVAESCHAVPVNTQCWQMAPYSSFIAEFKNPAALLPQGADGTVWANIGSNANPLDRSDGFVGSASATSLEIPTARKMIMPWYKLIFHTRYTHNKTVIQFVANSLASATASTKRELASVETPVENTVAEAQTEGSLENRVTQVDATVSLAQALQDVDSMTSNDSPAEITANMVQDVQSGVEFKSVLAGGIFDQMGLKAGDIVKGCTSATMNTPFDGLATLATTNTKGNVKLCITRGDQQLSRVVAFQ